MMIDEVKDVLSKDSKTFEFLTGYNGFDLYAVGRGRYVAFCNNKLVEYSKPVTDAEDAGKIIDADRKMEQFDRDESKGLLGRTPIYQARYLWKTGSEWVGIDLYAHESIDLQSFNNIDELKRVIDFNSDRFHQLWLSEFHCRIRYSQMSINYSDIGRAGGGELCPSNPMVYSSEGISTHTPRMEGRPAQSRIHR